LENKFPREMPSNTNLKISLFDKPNRLGPRAQVCSRERGLTIKVLFKDTGLKKRRL